MWKINSQLRQQVFNKELETYDLVLALSKDTKDTSFETDNYFIIVQDKKTLVYYYTFLTDELSDVINAMEEFQARHFFKQKNFELDSIYNITSLTSATSLEELMYKFELVFKIVAFDIMSEVHF